MAQDQPAARPRRPLRLFLPPVVLAIAVIATVFAMSRLGGRLTITAQQRAVIEQLRSVLMHDTLVPQYARVVNQFDGRGYVLGTGDFSTAGGEALEVIQTYTARVGPNTLSRTYLTTLTTLRSENSPAIDALAGLPDAWRLASQDPRFRQAQDDVLENLYYTPALKISTDLGLTTALGVAVVYDTILQHGNTSSPDSLPSIRYRASTRAGGEPREVSEHAWLKTFLAEREATLINPADERYRNTWPYNLDRPRALEKLIDGGHDDLSPPVTVRPYDTVHVLDGQSTATASIDDTGPPRAAGSSQAATPPPTPANPPRGGQRSSVVATPQSPASNPKPPTTSNPQAAPPAETTVAPRDGLVVRITAANGKWVGVADGASTDGAKIVLSGNSGPAQLWRLVASHSGCFHLINAQSGKALDNPDGTWTNGVQMQQWEYFWGNYNQSWCFTAVDRGHYSISNLANYYLLDVHDGGGADGTPIQQWGADPAAPNSNQTWRLTGSA
ncbi:chitosanase [Dactylosporangium sp. AC04546]|uniref:chitosanase n=1 Tax=Dactylosporangium sp. AC04546 TaxID=2862460 RepID=UPI001EE0967D|nr:chitosanase [Dactylosporangium sp. AC04546]WVK86732.1 chitosanase [Dactylosporangium sp. AC04546]